MGKHVAIVASLASSLINFRRPLIVRLLAHGHRVTALAPKCERTANELRSIGVELIQIRLRRTSLNPLADIILMFELIRVFWRIAPDCVLSYTAKPVFYGTIAARIAGVPIIAAMITGLGYTFIEGSGAVRSILGVISRFLYRLSLKFANIVFFQNPDDRQLFLNLGIVDHGKTRIVNGSGIDTNSYPLVAPPSSISFLMISRILADKGVREYVNASKVIRARHPNIPCLLVGWIDSNPAAISLREVSEWTKSGAIEYLGAVEDVRPLLAQCAVYVLPSYREGTPRTVLEAMSTGRAVITTDAPGCRETVLHGITGLLVAARSVESLVSAMEQCIVAEVDWRAMGSAGRRFVESKYDAQKVSDMVMSALKL